MAQPKENILETARRQGLATPAAGLKVPDGYFDDFCRKMSVALPYRQEIEDLEAADKALQPKTFWAKIRPYVYMAAMFAGVWCMLQMFASLTGTGKLKPMDDNPIMANALSDDNFVMDYIYDDISSWDVLDEMLEDDSIDAENIMEGLSYDRQSTSEPQGDYILPQ